MINFESIFKAIIVINTVCVCYFDNAFNMLFGNHISRVLCCFLLMINGWYFFTTHSKKSNNTIRINVDSLNKEINIKGKYKLLENELLKPILYTISKTLESKGENINSFKVTVKKE